jgi:hypothetical protein
MDTINEHLEWSGRHYDNQQTNTDIARSGLDDILGDLNYLLGE